MASTAPSRALTRVAPLVTLPALRLRIPNHGVLRAPPPPVLQILASHRLHS